MTDLERDLARAAIERVRRIHRPSIPSTPVDNGFRYCEGCWEAGGQDGATEWPCATIRALAGGTVEVTDTHVRLILCDNCASKIGQSIDGGVMDLSEIDPLPGPTAQFTENIGIRSLHDD